MKCNTFLKNILYILLSSVFLFTINGYYAIFTYLDGQIVLLNDGPDYESPLNNKAIS